MLENQTFIHVQRARQPGRFELPEYLPHVKKKVSYCLPLTIQKLQPSRRVIFCAPGSARGFIPREGSALRTGTSSLLSNDRGKYCGGTGGNQ